MKLPAPLRRVYTGLLPGAVRARLERCLRGPYPRVFDQKRFIFVHIPKTAGQSVCSLIGVSGACHLPYADYERLLGEKIAAYFVFTVVRDPLDRLRSAYTYMMAGGNQSAEDRAFKATWGDPYPSLAAFVCQALEAPPVATSRKFRPQTDFLRDRQGSLVERIVQLRFEHLSDDIETLPDSIRLKHSLPHLNRSHRDSGRLALDGEALRRAVAFYAHDYEWLGYPNPLADRSVDTASDTGHT